MSPGQLVPGHVPYLIVGAGTASVSAFRAIKAGDARAKVLLISAEGEEPYMRPPLSKELWFSDVQDPAASLKFKQWNGKSRRWGFIHVAHFRKLRFARAFVPQRGTALRPVLLWIASR